MRKILPPGRVQNRAETSSCVYEGAERTARDTSAAPYEQGGPVADGIIVAGGPPAAAAGPGQLADAVLEDVLLVEEHLTHMDRAPAKPNPCWGSALR